MADSRLIASGPIFPLMVGSGTTGEWALCTCTGESPLRIVEVLEPKRPLAWLECLLGADAGPAAKVGWRLGSRWPCGHCAWWDGWFGFAHGVCSMNCSPAAPRPCTNEARPEGYSGRKGGGWIDVCLGAGSRTLCVRC